MREVEYIDDAGRKWLVELPDDVPDSDAPLGVPVGPPSLASLGLPEDIEVTIHNGLYQGRIFASRDFKKRRMEVVSIIQRALNLDAERIYVLFLELEKE